MNYTHLGFHCKMLMLLSLLVCAYTSEQLQVEQYANLKRQSNENRHGNNDVQGSQNCTELYPRLFFTESASQMIIKFNTLSPCSRSFVTINQNYSITKYYCTSSQLRIEQKTVYSRFIQRCLVNIKTELTEFNYSIYGQSLSNQLSIKKVEMIYRVKIPQGNTNFNMIVTADWGPMQVRPYQPIYPSLLNRIASNQIPIHAMMLIGDLAYDLATNQCNQYDLFMNQLSVISPYLPIIPIHGNHQCNNDFNFQIFNQTFQCYNLSGNERVQSYHFWNFKIVAFNPYLQIYQKSTDEKYQIMRSALIRQLNEGTNKFTILTSHYPIICSQNVFHCQQTLLVMSEFYKQLSNLGKVDLYLGAHMHQYERIVSFRNGSFITTKRNSYGAGEMPSIVEGVAGCDVGIIDEDYLVQSFSVAHSYNKTGYGILTVSNLQSNPKAQYNHFITPTSERTELFDSVSIDTMFGSQLAIQQKEEKRAIQLKQE